MNFTEQHRALDDTVVRFVFARQNDGLYGVQAKVANVNDPGSLDLLHTLDLRRSFTEIGIDDATDFGFLLRRDGIPVMFRPLIGSAL
jgi:hypothetical protein